MTAEQISVEETAPEGLRVVQFLLTDGYYAVDVSRVSSVVEMNDITRVPRSAEAIDGVVDLRGDITAVINPWRLFDIEDSPVPMDEQLVMVFGRESDDQQIGLRVDEVLEVRTVDEDAIEHDADIDEFDTEAFERDLIRGVVRAPAGDGVDLLALIDVDAIVEAVGADSLEVDVE